MRSLFVALAVGLGWGIRGDFGHVVGAMYPGVALGLAFAFVTGQSSMTRWMPILGLAGGVGICAGGMMSYGILHGYAKSDTLVNYSYGFLTLILEGGAWGGFGCALIAMVLDRKPLRLPDWVSVGFTVYLTGWATYQVVVNLLGFHINPPRSDLSIGYTGGMMGLLVWLWKNGRIYSFKGAFFGFLGFGFGMAVGRLFGNISYSFPFGINSWNVMETSCGFIGGLVFTFTMLGKKFEEPSDEDWHPTLANIGILYSLAGIPILHFLYRIEPEKKLEEWANAASRFGIEETANFAQGVLDGLEFVCLLGFVGSALWYYSYSNRKERKPSAFPVLYLSLLMILFQNINALYFWYESRENYVNMHNVFWLLWVLMVLYAVFIPRPPITDPDEVADHVDIRNALSWAFVVYCFVLMGAGFANGEETMKSANTRFPLWSWRDGPFPRE
ncbi:MAG: hypothetical protein KC917_03150 [Candidatus Omnitrophica bacterium]|nr:hypothetical protein [Candidatus Omnitrophota bacterium]MCA9437352.1 hypothetical protein [Candidatus Omnitrophota bacterium]